MEIVEKVAVITGAAHGIGLGTALVLSERGARLCLVDHDKEALLQAVDQIAARGGEAMAVCADVTVPDSFESVQVEVEARFGPVDILMNNVGVLVSGLPQDIPLPEWERVLDINVMGTVRALHHFIPQMLARGSGHIVNTASFAALFPYAYDRLPYTASKGAIVAMTESLALYLKPRGIGVTLLCPGPVRTSIATTMRTFTQGIAPRGPGSQFELLEPLRVGEMVATAIEQNRFFLPTDEQVLPFIAKRGENPEAFLEQQLTLFDERQ
ncbi:SDR family NAD(P)-dependent oxidoreductase [Rhizorhapis sp. SPR117]|uniref:SDR family NAD(P)-dependent oxidoreductase n=1 Tax=Rhizorhapis sp. SPR117 TaxID=2912611 RepID=UPI001F1847E0|nr:SDR family oxidoreductase [Rhizorhapis sp. SPR117]